MCVYIYIYICVCVCVCLLRCLCLVSLICLSVVGQTALMFFSLSVGWVDFKLALTWSTSFLLRGYFRCIIFKGMHFESAVTFPVCLNRYLWLLNVIKFHIESKCHLDFHTYNRFIFFFFPFLIIDFKLICL